MYEMQILGGSDTSRTPSTLYLSRESDGTTRLPSGAVVAVIAGDDQTLAGWGDLDGPACNLALDMGDGAGFVRRDDLTVPVAEIMRLTVAGLSLPTVTACCGKSPLDCLYHHHDA